MTSKFISDFEAQLKQWAFHGNSLATDWLQLLRNAPDDKAKINLIREMQYLCREMSISNDTEDYLPTERK